MAHADDARFDAELSKRNLSVLRWTAIVFNVAVLAWSGFDRILAPSHWLYFLELKLVCVSLVTTTVILLHRPALRRHSTKAFALSFLIFAAFTAPMLPVVGSAFLAYTLGFSVIVTGAGVIPCWSHGWAFGTIAGMLALLLLAFAILGWEEVAARDLVAAGFFIATSTAVSVVSAVFKSTLLRRDFDMRLTLEAMTEQLARTNEELRQLSITDPLTGLINRRFFTERIEMEVARALRYRRPLACLMIDIDHFKRINDTYGHEVGDRALVLLAEIVRASIREMDVAARLGGEEFVVLAPETSLEGALQLAERLRRQMEVRTNFTVSIGVSSTDLTGATSPQVLLKLADEALYSAKKRGRNQSVPSGIGSRHSMEAIQ